MTSLDGISKDNPILAAFRALPIKRQTIMMDHSGNLVIHQTRRDPATGLEQSLTVTVDSPVKT